MKQLSWIFGILLLGAMACSPRPKVAAPAPEQRPDWVQQRPVVPGYYVGIGVVRKVGSGFDYLEQAKKNAFNDLVSQIQVTVEANSIQSQLERNKEFSDEFRSFTRLSSHVAIEDYEVAGSWQNESEYWLYYRLSVADYRAQKERRIQAAIDQSLDAYTRAQAAEKSGNLMEAYDFYFRALENIKPYIGEPLPYGAPEEQHFLGNDLLQAINKLSREIAIRVNVSNLQSKIGQPIAQELLISVAYPKVNGQAATNFPLKITFTQGAGTIVGNTTTDAQGNCRVRIANITARDALQEISITPDLEGLLANDRPRQMWLKVIDPQAMPREKVIVEVSPPLILLLSSERQFGNERTVEVLQSAAKQRLGKEGIRFTDQVEALDYRLVLEANTRQGGVANGMYTALLDLKVVLLDAKGNEKYTQTLSGIRGVQLDYQRAAEAAYRRAAEDLELTVLPKMINLIYNL